MKERDIFGNKTRLTGAGGERTGLGFRSRRRGGRGGRTVGGQRPGRGEEQLDAVVLEDVTGQRCQTAAGGETQSQEDKGRPEMSKRGAQI